MATITEIKDINGVVTKLEISNVENNQQAISEADKWCDENESYSENLAWEEEKQVSADEFETVFYVRVAPNDYE